MTRPPLMSSIVSVILATRPGLRNPVQATSDPIWMRSVALARPGHGREALPDAAFLFVPGIWNWLSGCAAEQEVVDDPDRVEADVFGRRGSWPGCRQSAACRRTRSFRPWAESRRCPSAACSLASGFPARFRQRPAHVPILVFAHRCSPSIDSAARRIASHGRAGDHRDRRNSEAPIAGASLLEREDGTPESLQRAVDAARGGRLHEPGAAQRAREPARRRRR